MRAILQRVFQASVSVDNAVCGKIASGLLVYLCVENTDALQTFSWISKKLLHMRMFEDKDGKNNLDLLDTKGEILIVPNFTLRAEVRKGNRPSFNNSLGFEEAKNKFEWFLDVLRTRIFDEVSHDVNLQTGIFGAHMQVESKANGPFNIILDSPLI